MKRCRECQNTYTDDSLVFCLQDGSRLEDAGVAHTEEETVVRASVPEAVTVAFDPDEKTEAITEASLGRPTISENKDGSKTLMTVLVTAVVMLLLVLVIGLSASILWMNFGLEKKAATSGNDNSNEQTGLDDGFDSRRSSRNSNPPVNSEPEIDMPIPSVETKKPATPETSETPDQATIKREVSGRIYRWVSLAESRNLAPYMDFYANRVDYYRKSGATKEFVRKDKSKAFSKFSTIQVRISSFTITPSNDGKKAVAEFDKRWLFANSDSRQTGKVRSKLIFENVDGEWKIVSEKDTKVYYVNK